MLIDRICVRSHLRHTDMHYISYSYACFLIYSDVEKIHLGIGDKVAVFLQFFTTFIACFVIAFVTNWRLALVVSVALPALILIGILLTKV